jgi:hypothetical protein
MPFILEVQYFNIDGHLNHPEWNGKSEHIGYMNKLFKTKKKLKIIMINLIHICVH